jgi:hypothetical protein
MPKTKKSKIVSETYSQEDYDSNDGFLTSIWGNSAWHFLHTISFNYPVNPVSKDKENYRNYVLSLRNVLPCGKCRANLKENFKKLPLRMADMKNRDTFSRYIFSLHELINTMLNKKSNLTYEEVRNTYENFRSRCSKKNKTVKKESGCTKPLYGKKAKCLLRIVPQEEKELPFHVDSQCIKRLV